MKNFIFLSIVFTSFAISAQDSIYPPIKVYEIISSGQSYNFSTGKTKTTTSRLWYFQEGSKAPERVYGDGSNLRPVMKGCDSCYIYLDKLKWINKKGSLRTLGGACFFVVSAATILSGIFVAGDGYYPYLDDKGNPIQGEKKAKAQKIAGTALLGAGAVSVGCTVTLLVNGYRMQNKHWPAQLKKTATTYNNYLRTLDDE